MDFKTFTETMRDIIKDYLPEEFQDATVELNQNQKLNEQYTGLVVRKPDQIVVPTINMDSAYKAFTNEDVTIGDVARQVANIIQNEPPKVQLDRLMEYESIKDQLFVRVSNAEMNADVLQTVPYTRYEDLALTYHIATEIDEDGVASTIVNNQLLEQYGITKEQLHEDAMKSAPQLFPARVETMGEVMKRMMMDDLLASGMDEETMKAMLMDMPAMDDSPMTVVTNENSANGAAVLFYPGQMDKIAENLEGDFFILPSSVHESLVIPDNGNFNYPDLKTMVQEVNSTQVLPAERLSDEVYHYDSKDKVFEKASTFDTRQKEKANVKQNEAEHDQLQKATKKHKSNDMSL